MEPKTTQNLFNDYFTNSIHKLILLCSAFFYKKVSSTLFKIALVFVLIFLTANSYSQSCKATLQVEKNRFTQSVRPEGTSYTMQILNSGASNSTYTLGSLNVNSNCSNSDGTSSSANVNLNITFSDMSQNSITEISLSPGETATFLANVTIPFGTIANKWNCTEITATSTTCPSYKVSTILHTLVSDPNQE